MAQVDEHGAIDAGTAKQLTALLNKPGIEDLVVMAHGWKNDRKDAARLYGTFWKIACANFAAGKAEGIIVAGAQWPAKAFRTDFDASHWLPSTPAVRLQWRPAVPRSPISPSRISNPC